MTAVGPPLGNARDILAPSAVHELRIANANPNIDKNEKFRFNSCLTPRLARAAASSCTLVLRRAAWLEARLPVDDIVGSVAVSESVVVVVVVLTMA
jgi:hypothetical protein